MIPQGNTLLLRLEGPFQAWGNNSKFIIRRTMGAPTKSGVLGLICCAMGVRRENSREELQKLNGKLAMGVRIDRPGTRWWDYHTVGAKYGILQAAGGIKKNDKTKKPETLVTRREYLCDASFLVVLQGDPSEIELVRRALENPVWPVFLGRKSCPPSMPIVARPARNEDWTNPMDCRDLVTALETVPWHPRLPDDRPPTELQCLLEWRPSDDQPTAPSNTEVWYDRAVVFGGASQEARLVQRKAVTLTAGKALQERTSPPQRARANYRNKQFRDARACRLKSDHGLCVFCKAPATTVQHITYRNAGGNESQDDLRSLCRLCHDAVTMIEYGLGMGLDRINPEDLRWRDRIIQKRSEILNWRSEERRRRALREAPEKVRNELLEQEGE